MISRKGLAYLLLAVMILSPMVPASIGMFHKAYADVEAAQDSRLQQALAMASPETRQCINCHLSVTPGIVYDWLKSEHAWNKPANVSEIYEAIQADYQIAEKFQNYNYTVGCYECHGMFKEQDRPDIAENHFGFQIVTIVTLKDCSQCHLKEAREITWTMHGFAALNAPLKPWYAKIVKYAKEHNMTAEMLPPVYEKTGVDIVDWPWYKQYAAKILNNPNDPEVQMFGTIYDEDFRNIVSPLYPASGVLASTGIMYNSTWKNAYVYHACLECHGSLVVPYEKTPVHVKYWGWPSNGAGRVDPDGSLGTCTACHTRHSFSLEEARKPYTCGQCHLGYDHPHIEIYEESKHGNIYDAEGETWNWSSLPWRVGVDFRAPTCATCHMSTIAKPDGTIVVKGTHDLRARLVWDQMHFFTYPKPKWPDFTQNAIIKGGNQLTGAGLMENGVVPEGYETHFDQAPAPGEFGFPRIAKVTYTGELKQKRDTMMKVCEQCHSPQWVENYFTTYDQNLFEYDMVAHYAYNLLQKAYQLGIQNSSNKLDEYMEIMWYYIWHHQGRRWRNGAAMMGPDFAHWFGIVDTVMEALGKMVTYYNTAVQIMELREQIQELQQQGANQAVIQNLTQRLQQLEQQLAAMNAQIPQLQSQLQGFEAKFDAVNGTVSNLQSEVENVKNKVNTLEGKVNNLSAQLDLINNKAEEAVNKAGKATSALAVGTLGLIIALISLGLVFARKGQ
ncbi:MAG: multiheme cytochrome [Desulfurococcales archaeon]|nr:multiheme cytochrome [Desulfurococcales archaeon]